MRKLPDVLLIGFTIMFLIIGLDQTLVLGLEKGYWAFMLALVTFFIFSYRKAKRDDPSGPSQPHKNLKKKRSR
jgi:uncharacterized membrane protein YiaA